MFNKKRMGKEKKEIFMKNITYKIIQTFITDPCLFTTIVSELIFRFC